MHVDKVISPSDGSKRQAGKRGQDETSVLIHVTHLAATVSLHRNTEDVDAVDGLTPWFVLTFPKANDVDHNPFLGKSLRGSPGSGIGRVMRKQEDSRPPAMEASSAVVSS